MDKKDLIFKEEFLERYEGNPIIRPADYPGAEAILTVRRQCIKTRQYCYAQSGRREMKGRIFRLRVQRTELILNSMKSLS